jgi:hypothetical protein
VEYIAPRVLACTRHMAWKSGLRIWLGCEEWRQLGDFILLVVSRLILSNGFPWCNILIQSLNVQVVISAKLLKNFKTRGFSCSSNFFFFFFCFLCSLHVMYHCAYSAQWNTWLFLFCFCFLFFHLWVFFLCFFFFNEFFCLI